MSTQNPEPNVEFMENGETTVVVVDDEAYNLSESDVAFHEHEENLLLLTADDVYVGEYDEDGWIIVDEDVPEFVLTALEEEGHRYADAEAYGFPVEFDVGYRSDDAVFRSAWQKEALRPSMDVAEQIQTAIQEVTLTIEVDADGTVRVTDVSLWPTHSNVSVDI